MNSWVLFYPGTFKSLGYSLKEKRKVEKKMVKEKTGRERKEKEKMSGEKIREEEDQTEGRHQ